MNSLSVPHAEVKGTVSHKRYFQNKQSGYNHKSLRWTFKTEKWTKSMRIFGTRRLKTYPLPFTYELGFYYASPISHMGKERVILHGPEDEDGKFILYTP